jgi:hypothetical protein
MDACVEKNKGEGIVRYHFIVLLKVVPQPGHLNRPIVIAFLPLGAIFQVFVGLATSILHFVHLVISYHPCLDHYRIF